MNFIKVKIIAIGKVTPQILRLIHVASSEPKTPKIRPIKSERPFTTKKSLIINSSRLSPREKPAKT